MGTFNQESKIYKFRRKKPEVVRLPKASSLGEETLAMQLRLEGISFEREKTFHDDRKWRFDFALPNNIAVEVEGGTWVKGRHSRGSGFDKDAEKYAEAILAGWRVFRFSTGMITSGKGLAFIKRALHAG